MSVTQKRMCGRPLKRILFVKRVPMGTHHGHVIRCYLECGHEVIHTSDTRLKAGRCTGCPTCQ